MAKLQNVTTVNMIDGEITAIKYDGAVYTKVDGSGKFGDVLLRVKRGITGQVTAGEYYEGHVNKSDDEQTIYYRDEDGDVVSTLRDRFVVFRKASETPQASAPFAEMVVSRVEAVEQRMDAMETKLAPASNALKIGDYAVVIGDDIETLTMNDVVQIRTYGNSYDFRVYRITDDVSELFNAEDLRKATEAEVAAATAPAKPVTGDIVVITANTNSSRNKVGDIGKVFLAKTTGARVSVLGNEAQSDNYTYYDEMRLATPAEIAQYEAAEHALAAQASKDSVFTKAGRKPNEYREGDVVRVTRKDGETCNFVRVVETVAPRAIGVRNEPGYKGVWFGNGDTVEIVCFAENRADLEKGAC